MKALIDGATSFLAALATLLVCGGPCWFTYQAIAAGAAPIWAWAFIVALGAIGVLMTFTFVEKGFRGISPSRTRRRR